MRRFRTTSRQFTATAKWLHWLTAFLLFSIIAYAWQFPFMAPQDRAEGIPVHLSIGVLVLILTLLRLAWRGASPPPALPQSSPGWVRIGSGIGHFGLYALILVQAALGIWMAAVSPLDIRFFNGFNLSDLAPANALALDRLRQMHLVCAVLLTMIIIGHICAAIWHHIILRDDVLVRMLPFGGLWQKLSAPARRLQTRFPSRQFAHWPKRTGLEGRRT